MDFFVSQEKIKFNLAKSKEIFQKNPQKLANLLQKKRKQV